MSEYMDRLTRWGDNTALNTFKFYSYIYDELLYNNFSGEKIYFGKGIIHENF